MAQAARLNLRMQKEIKLLLTDPPPGASFPLLSGEDATSSSSLSTIDAHIEGPEGTVYGQGVFKLKIQIPERYPFQPPNVTFATPIYHPNIDNGGRICLDILNLPPKGTWQPSLNISSVLTSIGLLLCEPNPDDGLMCDASREYKYNRQAFDQKARSMTEKFARIRATGNCSSSDSIPTNYKPNMVEIGEVKAQKIENHYSDTSEYNQNHGKISFSSGGKLSLEKHLISGEKRDSDKENVGAKHGNNDLQPHKDHIDTRESVSTSTKCKKLCLAGKKVEFSGSSQGQKSDQKENMMPSHSNSSHSEEKQKINQSLDRKGDITKHQGTEESLISETVIVLDSEDSEDERHGTMKYRLSVGRKRLAGRFNGRF